MPTLLLAFVLALAVLLLFSGLGDRAIFGDETSTATTALDVLREGLPIPREDDSFHRDLSVPLFGRHIIIAQPWVDKYLGAAAAVIFGRTSAGLRIPFAAIGVIFVGLMLAWGRRVLRTRGGILILATLLLGSLPLLIFLRAARYYSPTLALIVAFEIVRIGNSSQQAPANDKRCPRSGQVPLCTNLRPATT